jgi:hypothetical protein
MVIYTDRGRGFLGDFFGCFADALSSIIIIEAAVKAAYLPALAKASLRVIFLLLIFSEVIFLFFIVILFNVYPD